MKLPVFKILTLMLLVVSFAAKAQYIHDYQGKMYLEQSYTDVEGTPFLVNNWANGTVNLANGKNITAQLKYDLVKDELLFKNPNDSTAMVFVNPLKGFVFSNFRIEESDLVPVAFSSGYPTVDDQNGSSFYQVIADGKLKLLKRYRKTIRTDQAFNSATVTRSFVLNVFYYLLAGGKMTRIKPSSKTIVAVMADNETLVQAFIKSNKTDFKSDKDLFALFNYYNSL